VKHSLSAEGFGIRVRPVCLEDAAFIVWLRNLDHVKGKIGDSVRDVAGQEAWLKAYFQREGDYYFIAETAGGIPFGTHAIYDVKGTRGEKGRHVMRPEVLAGVPAGMLVTDLAFGTLGLTELRSHSVSTNLAVHSLHRKTGFKQVGVKRNAQIIDGKPVDLLEFLITAEDWARVRDGLLPIVRLAGAQALEWEKTQSHQSQPWMETGDKLTV
jgi:RimJ/RimL family protein N-acetyltransferase